MCISYSSTISLTDLLIALLSFRLRKSFVIPFNSIATYCPKISSSSGGFCRVCIADRNSWSSTSVFSRFRFFCLFSIVMLVFSFPTTFISSSSCDSIWNKRKKKTTSFYFQLNFSFKFFFQFPNTKNEWLCIANSFHSRWNFPHCVGAVDGKHVSIQNPHNSGSHYFNYKGTYSIILLAVADASYKLIYFDVGCNGRISDGGVFQNSSLHQGLEDGSIELPEPTPLPGRTDPVPYCFFGDDAFAMKPYMLKPYPYQNQPAPNRIFNYRLSRARRIIENVFGIMANKFRVLRKPIALAPETVSTTVQAICALHNYLLSDKTLKGNYIHQDLIDTENTETHTLIPGSWRDEIPNNSYFPLQKGK
ncbi:putative nuclease HARBI1 isoform X1 [Photinus pyralis]|uniref:putative nuclease HARBI1 isoform X1 n=1 Tax=Photinus pyralis TaxID=7054 RepID=UPI001266E930|nr:putative nuclease HARBI1 isoform X1 [Photinus pyralis]